MTCVGGIRACRGRATRRRPARKVPTHHNKTELQDDAAVVLRSNKIGYRASDQALMEGEERRSRLEHLGEFRGEPPAKQAHGVGNVCEYTYRVARFTA